MTGASVGATFMVEHVTAGSYDVAVTGVVTGTVPGDHRVCGPGSTARTMAETSFLTIMAYEE